MSKNKICQKCPLCMNRKIEYSQKDDTDHKMLLIVLPSVRDELDSGNGIFERRTVNTDLIKLSMHQTMNSNYRTISYTVTLLRFEPDTSRKLSVSTLNSSFIIRLFNDFG